MPDTLINLGEGILHISATAILQQNVQSVCDVEVKCMTGNGEVVNLLMITLLTRRNRIIHFVSL